jgi:hypothetical protein
MELCIERPDRNYCFTLTVQVKFLRTLFLTALALLIVNFDGMSLQ